MVRWVAAAMVATVLATACTSEPSEPTAEPGGSLSEEAQTDAGLIVRQVANRIYDPLNPVLVEPIERLPSYGDERLAWIIADALRFVGRGPEHEALMASAEAFTGLSLDPTNAWLRINNHLLENDVAPPPGYRAWKAEMFEAVDVTWTHLFSDDEAVMDWRHLTFGGVLADRRSYGSDESCLCIPSLDEPPHVPAHEGDWYPDGDVVFGIVVNGEARAYPRNIMATHEMVNDVLGGRRIAIPYCTLCGSAHAYFLDDLPEPFDAAVLRTSGLLQRSNKVSFDLQTLSMVDTFTGRAISGPWREAGIELTFAPMVASTWGTWRQAHPDTTLMAGKNGTGAEYPLELIDPLPDTGLAFPVGAIDSTLFPETVVLGVIAPDGQPVAFERAAVFDAVVNTGTLDYAGITLTLDGTGLVAVDADGAALRSHEAAWFAWSQFHPTTELWSPDS